MMKVNTCLDDLSAQIRETVSKKRLETILMIGIRTGGVWVAEKLHQMLSLSAPLGQLDITFYRDDFSRIGLHPKIMPSTLPFDIEDRHLLLVDDVLYTGRTIKAALNEIFDYGHPASVLLAVLVDRSGRELPIQSDFTGCHLSLKRNEHVKLTLANDGQEATLDINTKL